MKTYLAEKQQLDAQNVTLGQINAKIAQKDLSSIDAAVLDFICDTIVISSGGLDSSLRRITT